MKKIGKITKEILEEYKKVKTERRIKKLEKDVAEIQKKKKLKTTPFESEWEKAKEWLKE